MKTFKYILFSILAVIVIISLFYGINKFGLFDVDEAIYAEVAREMLETKDYILPQYNYLPWSHKPVFYYWILCLSYKLFGINEFAARLPSGVFILALLILIYYFIKKLFGNKQIAIFSAFILATNMEIMIISKAVLLDALFTLLVSLSLICFATGYFTDRKNFYYGTYIFGALAVLTKGPAGVVLPFCTILLFLLLNKEIYKLKEIIQILPIILFFVIVLPWYIAVGVKSNGNFLKDFLIYHNIIRFSHTFESHSGNIFYYPIILLTGFYPWVAFLPVSITRYFKDKKIQFFIVWSGVVFAFFTISQTKLPNYIAPMFPAIAVLVGNWWNQYITTNKNFKLDITISMIIFVLLTLSLTFFFTISDKILQVIKSQFDFSYLKYVNSIGEAPTILATGFLIILLFTFLAYRSYLKNLLFGLFVITIVFFNFISVEYLVPKVWYHLQGGLYQLAERIKHTPKEETELVIYDLHQPSIIFYTNRKVKVLKKDETERLKHIITNHNLNKTKVYIITDEALLKNITEQVNLLQKSLGYLLLSN